MARSSPTAARPARRPSFADKPPAWAQSRTRRPERPILFACAAVGLLFALLTVLERVGVDRNVLGALAVVLPCGAVAVLALIGRTIDRLPFVVDDARGGSLGNGLALGAEWLGSWGMPAAVLVPLAAGGSAAPILLGTALGLVVLVVAFAPTMRRVQALSPAAFLSARTGSALIGPATALAQLAALGGLAVFQLVLLRTLLIPFVGPGADAVLLVMIVLAAAICIVGGQRSLTLVNAFLAFFLTLAVAVPALAVVAGIDGLTAALPLDRGFVRALPGAAAGEGAGGLAGRLAVLMAFALAWIALPSATLRLAAVRRGASARTGAWVMLAGYVVASAAALAFARTVLSPGLTLTANGEPSILSVLPALGWLGAAWAGFAMSLFAVAAVLGRDLLAKRNPAGGWMEQRGVVVMRLVFLLVPVGAWFALRGTLPLAAPVADLLDVDTARGALGLALVASGGVLAPGLVAGVFWRHVTVPGLVLGQVGATALALVLWPLLDAVLVTLIAGAGNAGLVFAGAFLTPRRWRPAPSLLAVARDP